jgi:sugar/nucleoside kinase (ribokinase family)
MLEINLLGPLCIEINLKVQMGACLVGDAHLANYKGLTFGGPLLKTARLLSTLGHSCKLWNYLGNDEFGNKIIENIKQEKIEANIQIIPNAPTPIICKLSDKKDYSCYTTQIKDLSLWEFRIKNLKDSGVIFIDPAIPTEIQLEIIKKTKKAILLLKKPLDGKLDIFYQPKNLIILLNEYEIFQIFAQTEYKHFDPSRMLTHKILHNHNILLESKYNITTLDD